MEYGIEPHAMHAVYCIRRHYLLMTSTALGRQLTSLALSLSILWLLVPKFIVLQSGTSKPLFPALKAFVALLYFHLISNSKATDVLLPLCWIYIAFAINYYGFDWTINSIKTWIIIIIMTNLINILR